MRISSAGQTSTVEADLVVHAAGREPALEGLDLDAAGIAVEGGRLKLRRPGRPPRGRLRPPLAASRDSLIPRIDMVVLRSFGTGAATVLSPFAADSRLTF